MTDAAWRKSEGERSIREAKVWKFLAQCVDKVTTNMVHLVERLELVPLFRAGRTTHRRDVDHACPVLDKGATLARQLDAGDVAQHKVDEGLVPFLADVLDEAHTRQLSAHPVGRQPVLGEAVVEQPAHVNRVAPNLFLLLDQVGAANKADGAFVPQP